MTRKAWRVGYHVLEIGVSVHTVVLRLPDNGRKLVAPGCVECRALPHFAHACAPEVRDCWRLRLRIPYPPPIIISRSYGARPESCRESPRFAVERLSIHLRRDHR